MGIGEVDAADEAATVAEWVPAACSAEVMDEVTAEVAAAEEALGPSPFPPQPSGGCGTTQSAG